MLRRLGAAVFAAALALATISPALAFQYSTTVATARLQKVIDAIDGGTGNGVLVIGTSALSGATGVCATITLQKPSATISGRVLTLSGTPLTANASASCTAAKAELRDSAGTVVVSGFTVGTSGSDINLITTSITSGQPVQVTSGSITHP